MLKTYFIYFVVLSILFVNMGCQNKAASHLPILYYSGEATAIVNGINWKAKVIAYGKDPLYAGKIGLHFEVYNEYNELREATGVGNLFPVVNSNILIFNDSTDSTNLNININPNSRYVRMSNDGDVLSDIYKVAENKTNWINITKWDPTSKELEGNFEITFGRDTSFNHQALDTLFFTNGHFFTKILN